MPQCSPTSTTIKKERKKEILWNHYCLCSLSMTGASLHDKDYILLSVWCVDFFIYFGYYINNTSIWSNNLITGYIFKYHACQIVICNHIHCSIVTTANIENQIKCVSMKKAIRKSWYTQSLLFSLKTKWNIVICYNMDKFGRH
jgi:hypothetical protein